MNCSARAWSCASVSMRRNSRRKRARSACARSTWRTEARWPSRRNECSDLNELQREGVVVRKRVYAVEFQEEEGQVRVRAVNLADGSPLAFTAKRVYLGLGTIASKHGGCTACR